MLVRLGCEVTEAEDGKVAVNYFVEGNEYDLVLMDKQMKEMNGVEAIRTLKSMGVKAKMVAITSDESSNEAFLEAGVDAFLTKPVKLAELTSVLRTFDLLN
ncbi:histidine kinase 2 [Rhynchospora pubera]|uniref:Histidine kinase 2 n=1 Tax=Rhynchospora pubera TaxID=906938 RepID=A0AAV8DJZ1_9POAL|nr:histidine kinase 2 [Rhynchospora pubera]